MRIIVVAIDTSAKLHESMEIDWRLAEALAIERWKGLDAPTYIAERIALLALAGDKAGVERFGAIATKFNQLRSGTVQ